MLPCSGSSACWEEARHFDGRVDSGIRRVSAVIVVGLAANYRPGARNGCQYAQIAAVQRPGRVLKAMMYIFLA